MAEEDAPKTTFRHYTFGAPRVFNPKLARYYEELPVPTYRIVNVENVVTAAPLPVAGNLTYHTWVLRFVFRPTTAKSERITAWIAISMRWVLGSWVLGGYWGQSAHSCKKL